jgi:hypothetical protein
LPGDGLLEKNLGVGKKLSSEKLGEKSPIRKPT